MAMINCIHGLSTLHHALDQLKYSARMQVDPMEEKKAALGVDD
jgi:hypothetical protein